MLTYKLKLVDDINIQSYLEQYSKCFRIIYNNLDLLNDKSFNNELKIKFNLLDSWFIQCAKIEAKTKYEQLKTSKEKIKSKINDINFIISNKQYKNKNQLYKLKNKLSLLNKDLNKNIVFGGKTLLKEITKLKQTYIKTNNIDLYNEYIIKLNKYKNNRILSISSIGEQPQKSNRKYNFDLNNCKLTFKPNAKTKIDIKFKCSNKQQSILNKIQTYIGIIPISIKLDNRYVYITFDEEKLFDYEFKTLDYFKEIKDKDIKKDIYKKYLFEQKERKLKNKVKDRYCAVDLNPEYIGLCIVDKNNFNIIYKYAIDLTKLNNRLKLSSNDKIQIKQNNKRRYEIFNVWKHIFDICKHYRVSNFVIEELNFKNKVIKDSNKEFNRKTKNIWHRGITNNMILKYCNMLGIELIEVNAVYSSFIGNLTYNYFDPVSASLEICRRGMNKYIKGNKMFGSIETIDLKKVENYLSSKNVQCDNVKELTISKLFKHLSGLKYRNSLNNSEFLENQLKTRKSNIKCYTFI